MRLKKFIDKFVDFIESKPVAKYTAILIALLVLLMAGALTFLAMNGTVPVLDPSGIVALKERNILLFAMLLSLIVIVPVYVLLIFIIWRYRESNKKANYAPDWDNHNGIEATWWGIPLLIVAVLSVVTWFSSHDLDPYKALDSDKEPVTVQVVALQWKWLFIYPEYDIAAVDYFQIPVDRPINFEITADAPMNSFWIPQLGGQVYAMAAMTTKLHLAADEPGVYQGVSANISGEGFASMNFEAEAVSEEDFQKWVDQARRSDKILDIPTYKELAKPSIGEVTTYVLAEKDLHDTIVMKFMEPDSPLIDSSEESDNTRTNQGGSGYAH